MKDVQERLQLQYLQQLISRTLILKYLIVKPFNFVRYILGILLQKKLLKL